MMLRGMAKPAGVGRFVWDIEMTADGKVLAAVSVVGPSFRLHGHALETAVAAVAACAAAVERALGVR